MKLIDKDAVVAEIEKIRKTLNLNLRHDQGVCDGLYAIQKYINTLEVKEVEKEIPMWIKEIRREDPFDDRWFIGLDDCLHRNGYKIKICDLWNLPKEPFNT